MHGQEHLYLYDGRIIYACPGMETEAHRHVAAEILIATGEASFIVRHSGREEEFQAAMISPNTDHELLAGDTELMVFMIDPDSQEFQFFADDSRNQGVRALDRDDFRPLFDRFRAARAGSLSCRDSYQLLNDLLMSMANFELPPRQWDERIARVLEMIKNTADLSEVSIYKLAEAIGVSDNRLMHLFKDHMGLPLRRYLLWLRVRRVAMMIKDGVNITEAAHAAGFSDAAHLSRTFKEMFGVPPTFFLNSIEMDSIQLCDSV
ncbi:MAG: AraC family transcriptional regulator [bacterium]|nr:AraC family transcriptional regulator [bacterium]